MEIKTPPQIITSEMLDEQTKATEYKHFCKCCGAGYLKSESAIICQIMDEKDAEGTANAYKISYPDCADEYLEEIKSDYKTAIKNHESYHIRMIRKIEK